MKTLYRYTGMATATLGFTAFASTIARSQEVPDHSPTPTSPVAFVCLAPRLVDSMKSYEFRQPFVESVSGAEFKFAWKFIHSNWRNEVPGDGDYTVTANKNNLEMWIRAVASPSTQRGTVRTTAFGLVSGDGQEPYVLVEPDTQYKVTIDTNEFFSVQTNGTMQALSGVWLGTAGSGKSKKQIKNHFEAKISSAGTEIDEKNPSYPIIEDAKGMEKIIENVPLTRRFSVRQLAKQIVMKEKKKLLTDGTLVDAVASITEGTMLLYVSNKVQIRVEAEPVVSIFIGGAGDETLGVGKGPVITYVNEINRKYRTSKLDDPKRTNEIKYFAWTQGSEIIDYINKLPENAQINLIGHSYGGDTAVEVAIKCRRRIDNLVTIDPVGGRDGNKTEPPDMKIDRTKPPYSESYLAEKFKKLKGKVVSWFDVNAKLSIDDKADLSDIVAVAGRDWGDLPGKYGAKLIIANSTHHADFFGMMKLNRPNGQRIEKIIPGM